VWRRFAIADCQLPIENPKSKIENQKQVRTAMQTFLDSIPLVKEKY